MVIKLIVGIGNIGLNYINTRHNMGQKYVTLLSNIYHIVLKRNNVLHGYIGKLKIKELTTYLLIPNSYINNSGLSVSKCVDFFQLSLQEVLIVHDDLDLFPGIVRFTLKKSFFSSHNGIRDIVNKLNNFNFYRLRIGIGRPNNKNQIIDFVLNPPSIYDQNKIDSILNRTIVYTEDIVSGNFIKVMNQLHSYCI